MLPSGYKKTKRGIEYRYYRCWKKVILKQCTQSIISAPVVEEAIIKLVRKHAKVVLRANYFESESRKKIEAIGKKILSLDRESERLIIHLGKGSLPPRLIEKRIAEINQEKSKLMVEREQLGNGGGIDREILIEAASKIEKLESMSFEEKRASLQLLIKSVVVRDKTVFEIEYFWRECSIVSAIGYLHYKTNPPTHQGGIARRCLLCNYTTNLFISLPHLVSDKSTKEDSNNKCQKHNPAHCIPPTINGMHIL